MVPADKVHLGLLDQFPDVRGFQVGYFIFVSGREVRDHASVVARDYHPAAAGWSAGVDEVFGTEASSGTGGAEGIGVGVGAYAADVEDGGGREDVLFGRRG